MHSDTPTVSLQVPGTAHRTSARVWEQEPHSGTERRHLRLLLSGELSRRLIQNLQGYGREYRKGRALGELLDEVSALLQAPRELRIQGHRACKDRWKGEAVRVRPRRPCPCTSHCPGAAVSAALAQSEHPVGSTLAEVPGRALSLNFYLSSQQPTQEAQTCCLVLCSLAEKSRARSTGHMWPCTTGVPPLPPHRGAPRARVAVTGVSGVSCGLLKA